MTDAQPELNVLALNSGSSSLKFGLYRVGSFRIEMLLSGEAELIGEKNGKFFAQEFARNRFALPRRYPFPANGKRSYASEDFSPTPKCRRRPPSGIESCMADQSSGSIASSMIRSYGNLKPRLPSRRCTFHQLCRSSASHKSIFPGFRRWRASTPRFTPDLPEVARVLPISRELQLEGIQRYGFHGLSCESIVRQLAKPPAATRSRAESIPSIPSIFI